MGKKMILEVLRDNIQRKLDDVNYMLTSGNYAFHKVYVHELQGEQKGLLEAIEEIDKLEKE